MATDKVIYLNRENAREAVLTKNRDLFGNIEESFGQIVFLPISKIDQDILLSIITKYPVSAIFDVRSSPVFARPNFYHAQVADYIHGSGVLYFDLTRNESERVLEAAIIDHLAGQPHPIIGRFTEAMDKGLVIVLFEEGTRGSRLTGQIRRLLRHHLSFRAELPPHVLS